MRFHRIILALICAVILSAFFLMPEQPILAEESDYRALFINVGKADAILLMLGEERYLVDTGTKDTYDQLEKVLGLYGVSKLDAVFITHTDKDHVGGLKKLVKSDIQVDMVYAAELHNEESHQKHEAFKTARKKNISFTWLKAGDVLDKGDYSFEVLGPLKVDWNSENNNSLVMNLKTPHGNILLTGDMEFDEERQLLQAGLIPQATVLKVAHHGDNDSTSDAFIKAVSPQWAIISTSSAEEPDTPDNGIMTALWNIKAGVAVTEDAEVGILVSLLDGNATAQQIDLN